jgi:hypothetical protein
MTTAEKISHHLATLSLEKSAELSRLYQLILDEMKGEDLLFFDGKNEQGKVVANPTIGFGQCRLTYADGSFQDTFRLGISANSTGLSIHILGLKDKKFLVDFLGTRLGKAKITGYAIRFGKMRDIDEGVLKELVREILKNKKQNNL